MDSAELIIFIIESLNVIATALFLILFWRRLCKIRAMSVTNKYLDKHWAIRVIAAIIYILVSACLLTLELIKYVNETNWLKQLLLSGSVGFCLNSLILIGHIVVISQELRKQIPFSNLHQAFLIYMPFISCFRLGLIIYQFQLDMNQRFELFLLILSVSLAATSIFMLVYWVRKKKTMPAFDDLSKVDINTITERIINPVMYDHHSLPDKTEIEHWNLIVPNTTVETGKVRIILEMYTEDDILKSLANEQTKSINDRLGPRSLTNTPGRFKQHLQIISDRLYTLAEIKKIYLQCCRFDMETKIIFQGASMADFYRQIKKFMEELFSIKKSYVPEILQLFSIDKTSMDEINSKVQRLIKFEDELLVSSYIDHNALFLSIEVFKHQWAEDHFIFYIHSVTMDHHERAVCYKRFTDFEEFHHKLQKVIASDHKGPYKLPELPKKHFFSMTHGDTQKAKQRSKQLQKYCQQTFNDYNLMTKMPRAKQLIFSFLRLNKTFDVSPSARKAIQFYDGLEIRKGSIYKALVEEEYVTFYEFELFRNGIMLRSIFKRFRQFIALHNSLQNWMQNCQIIYKFLVLPEKVLYKSETKRHQKLISYLENIITIKDIYKIHEVNKFFNMGHHYDSENSAFGMSIIKKQPSDCEEMPMEKREGANYDFSMESEKQRMSLLIEELGEQG